MSISVVAAWLAPTTMPFDRICFFFKSFNVFPRLQGRELDQKLGLNQIHLAGLPHPVNDADV